MVICLERGADLWCHCHSLSLASVKSRLVLPFWYQLTWVVQEKGPLNVCSSVVYLANNDFIAPHDRRLSRPKHSSRGLQPCPRLCITEFVMINTTVNSGNHFWNFTHNFLQIIPTYNVERSLHGHSPVLTRFSRRLKILWRHEKWHFSAKQKKNI